MLPSVTTGPSAIFADFKNAISKKISVARDAILMEHSHIKANQPVKQTASKLSTVKRKGTNPKWQPKQQLSEKKDDEETSEKKPRAWGCRSGKEV